MRCKLHDHVIVIAGPAAGASGTIVAAAPLWAKDSHGVDWIVEFPEPVPGYDDENSPSTDLFAAYRDRSLLPVNPPADPEHTDTTDDIEVRA